jgi:endonuclease I
MVWVAKAQLHFKADSLSFGTVNELQVATQSIWVYNSTAFPVRVTGVDLFELYNLRPFTVKTPQFTVAAADSFLLEVDFSVRHNVKHNLALVLKTNSGFGHEPLLLKGQGRYSKIYYSSTRNKTEEALKTALKNRIGLGYNALSYSVARDNMYATIDNNGGQVEGVYTGRTANFTTRSGANANSFNCEHTFPQGFFNQSLPMRSDIHHLFPTDVAANSQRGNDPFGVVTNASWSVGGSKSGGGRFEPRNAQKGATARAMMYFVIRYQDYANHFQGQENLLRGWHQLYPPSAAEQSRNNAIFSLQNNRNPFVDYPQLEDRITQFVGNSLTTPLIDLYFSDDTIFLARGNGNYTYNFVVYNRGNQPLQLSNFTVANPSITLTAPTGQILPGQAQEVQLAFNASTVYNTQLQFADNQVPAITYSIPVISGPVLSGEEQPADLLSFYPNPVRDVIHLENFDRVQRLTFYNLNGALVANKKPASKMDISNLKAGFYVVRGTLYDGTSFQRKLLKR